MKDSCINRSLPHEGLFADSLEQNHDVTISTSFISHHQSFSELLMPHPGLYRERPTPLDGCLASARLAIVTIPAGLQELLSKIGEKIATPTIGRFGIPAHRFDPKKIGGMQSVLPRYRTPSTFFSIAVATPTYLAGRQRLDRLL